MTRTIEITETREALVQLNDAQVFQLNRLSKELASGKTWWGADETEERDRRIISVHPAGLETHRIVVRDSVGVISLPDLKIIVKPKIPDNHFAYIASYALFGDPRTISSRADLAAGSQFHELIVAWFLEEVSSIQARGLQTGYSSIQDDLTFVRGRVNPAPTYLNVSRGRLALDSEFEELGIDTPANRIISTALNLADLSAIPNSEIQSKGQRLRSLFKGLPKATSEDLKIHKSQVEKRYSLALEFAKSIIKSSGRSLDDGTASAKTFLVRTPSLIEEGIRKILIAGLKPIEVTKKGKTLNTGMRVMPDLTLARPPFTADVKYKNRSDQWGRADLAQGVFFAEAFRSPIAAIVSFSRSPIGLQPVQVGNIRVESIDWRLDNDLPEASALGLINAFKAWLPESEKQYPLSLGWPE